MKTFYGHSSIINFVSFSLDEKTLISGDSGAIHLWEIATGKEIRKFSINNFTLSFAISPDGKFIANGSGDIHNQTIELREIKTGRLLHTLNGHQDWVNSVAFSPDSKILVSGSSDKLIKLWDVETGKEIKTLNGHSYKVNSVIFSPDGKTLASGSDDSTIKFWNVENGEAFRTLSRHSISVNNLAFSPDEKTLASGNANIIKIWNIGTGKVSKTLYGHQLFVNSLAFSPDGTILASGSQDNTIKLWDVKSGIELRTIKSHWSISLAFSPDGKILADGHYGGGIGLWDVDTGENLKFLGGHSHEVTSIGFSVDGKILVSGGTDENVQNFTVNSKIKLWEVASGKLLETLDRFSPTTKEKILKLAPQYYEVEGNQAFSKNLSATYSETVKIKLFSHNKNKELATLISLDDDDWIITTPEGRFDTNKSLDFIEGLHWILNNEILNPLPLDIFMRDYYEPNLLPRLLKCTEEETCDQEFKPVRDLTSLNRTQPKIEIKKIKKTASPDTVEVTVEAENVTSEFQKGADTKALISGVFDLRLFRDGQLVEFSTTDENLQKIFRTYKDFDEELKVWREANRVDLKDGKKTFSFQVKLPNDAAGKPIEFSAYAFNDDRVKSETSRKTFTFAKETALKPKPRKSYVITFGVNKYDNAEWNLQFAGNDARAMREIVAAKLRSRKEFVEVVEIPLISDDETAGGKTIEKRDATKGNVKTALDLLSGKTVSAENIKSLEKAVGVGTLAKIKQANPDDMVLLSFSSHGYADRNGIFYILPTDIGKNSGRKVTDELLGSSISSDELSLWLRDVDAGEMVMIVDACHAASAVEGKDFKPAPMGSRGLGQLAFDKGMKILTATQAANAAIESGGTIGHGLLTYALLREGLDKSEADFKAKDKTINLKEWLEYGEFEVPKLYEKLASGKLKGIGRGTEIIDLSGNDKNQISLQTPTLFDFTRKNQEMILVQLP